MSIEENKALVRLYIHISEDFDRADEILAPDFVDHSHPEFRPGHVDRDGFRTYRGWENGRVME